jgi:hypothetical protein
MADLSQRELLTGAAAVVAAEPAASGEGAFRQRAAPRLNQPMRFEPNVLDWEVTGKYQSTAPAAAFVLVSSSTARRNSADHGIIDGDGFTNLRRVKEGKVARVIFANPPGSARPPECKR